MHATSPFLWPNSADKLCEALHVSAKEPLRCIGHTSKSKGCTKPINKVNRVCIQQLLDDVVAAGSWGAAQLLLERLSKLVLCQGERYGHQKQGNELLRTWKKAFEEAEMRHAVAESSANPGTTLSSTNSTAFKSESNYINTYAVPAFYPEETTKSESDEDSDLSSLATTAQEEVKPLHTFVPYGKLRTQKQINKAIKGIIGKPLSEHEKKSLSTPGVVYIYKHADAAGGHGRPHLKIGFTADLDRRIKDWQRRCGYDAKRMSHTEASLYMRVERLVHAQLWACRKREEQCPGCGGSHKEFFDVRLHEANKVIGLWAEWMEHAPYGKDGTLNAEWQEKLRDVDCTDPDCWERFTAKQ
ncbi:hypothetical protein V2A60_001063 [Cordyceps javanica]|uniref:Bacteriophage T5 Orf172 DNA-binding domain-containing protein n=1 Tax=Cordyceps javanica TaxID=43265 RepID=A0A545VYY8_9HYPO|nr:hypothetical protein IF1G_05725 [Cordyceps javanica]TQW06905.1 hypothetical protein IF2G_05289 [Cordyceps javanica]